MIKILEQTKKIDRTCLASNPAYSIETSTPLAQRVANTWTAMGVLAGSPGVCRGGIIVEGGSVAVARGG